MKIPWRFCFLGYTHEGMVSNTLSFIKGSPPAIFYAISVTSKGMSCIFRVQSAFPTHQTYVHTHLSHTSYICNGQFSKAFLGTYRVSSLNGFFLWSYISPMRFLHTWGDKRWRDLPEITPLEGKIKCFKNKCCCFLRQDLMYPKLAPNSQCT